MKKYASYLIALVLFFIPIVVNATVHLSVYNIPYTVSSSVNSAPTVNAGPDVPLVSPTSSTTITGTATDSDGSITGVEWKQVLGPATATIANPTVLSTGISGLSCITLPCTYVFRLTATDNDGAQAFDDMQIFITTTSPDLTAGSSGPTIAMVGTPISFVAIVTNQGGASTGSSFPVFFQVASAAFGGGTITDLTPSTMATLASGASDVASSPLYTFSGTGIHSVRVCADAASSAGGGTIAESDESNNCGAWTRVSVSPAATYTPSVTLSAAPSSVYKGGSSVLSWVSANVTSCTASASPASATWTGSRPVSSSYPHESTGALTTSTTFTLSCTGAYGPAVSSVKVSVVAAGVDVVANLTATPDKIASGDSSVLSWSSANATSCTGRNFPTGGATAGSVSVSPTVTTTYQMECTDGTNTASAQATVTLRRRFLFIEY